jgi:PAS domain S-box-containing protein
MSTRILVVEDSATEALRARLVLEREGYTVSVAGDGKEALARASADNPDLIILDTVMPRMSGYEVWERLRADIRTRHIPVILLTPQEGFNDVPHRLDCDSFVTKPYQPTSLVGRVRDMAAGRDRGSGQTADSEALETLGIGSIVLREGRISRVNHAAESLLGLDARDASGKPFAERFLEEPDSFASLLSQASSNGGGEGEFRVRLNGTGAPRWWRIHASSADVPGQPATRLVCADVSDRVRAVEEAARAKEEVRRLQAELEQAKKTKGNFLATMSHELRTPLHEFMGMNDLVLGAELTNEQRLYLETAKTSAGTLLALVNDILEFTELEAGQVGLEEKSFDLRATIEATVAIAAPSAQEKGLAIECRLAQDVPTELIGDPKRIRQVLTSLLSNAVKFTEQGKVGVEAMLEASTPSEVEVHFVVHDTGIGIPKEKLGLIFDVFQQADDSTTRRYGGIGLGLTMSQQLARLMGGRIWAESEPDKGTTFHFTSRLKRQKVLEESAPAAQAEPEALHLRILLAEDSPTNQLIATTNLKKAGHTVQVANNGRKAVQAWEAGEFDLILMDMAMPEMDGLEVTQAIRQKEKGTGRHTPVIAMTAFALKEYQDKCRLAGMDGYVTKPVSPDELHRAITPFLAQRRKQPALPEKPSEPPVKLDEALEVVGGDLDLLRDVVQMSLNECPEQVQALRGAMDQQDAHGVERSAHRLKGILGNVGGMAAREAVQRLESMGTRGDLAGGPAALKRFEDELRRVVTFFSQPGWEKTIMVQQGG